MKTLQAITAIASLLAMLVVACSSNDAPPPPPPRHDPPPETPPAGALVKRSRPLMGTVFSFSVADATEAAAEPALLASLDEVARLESMLSEWIPDSEVSRINAQAGIAPVVVSEDLITVVKASLDVARRSEGAFDITWAALHGLYMFREDEHRHPTPRELAERLPLIDYRDVIVDEQAHTVFLRRAGMKIGLGGIAKGYALDRAADVLKRAGFMNFLLFGGGQVLVNGRRGGRPWRIGIQHPRQADYFAFFEAESGSVATSGDYEHFFIDDRGKRWHHIIDVRTGMPSEASLSVTVHAPTGLLADAVDTAVFILGPTRGLAMLAAMPERIEAVIVDPRFRIVTTPGTNERLRYSTPIEDGVLPH